MTDLDGQRRKRPGDRTRIDQIKDEMDQDVLRARIATAIQKAHAERPLRFSLLNSSWDENCLAMADAVIRAVSAYHREVSEDDFLDALSEADDE
jgi:hypothetical protein